jgi:uncharacterized protein (TIGR00730 family)
VKRVAVFCGSNFGLSPSYRSFAEDLGRELLKRNLGLVYGGGNVGLMGAIAEVIHASGGEVIGVIPDDLLRKEVGKKELKDLRVVNSMHERKKMMSDLSDGFIALPGGFGTLEEFFEILTWAQLGYHKKPCGLLNVDGYYDLLIAFLLHARSEQFIKPEAQEMVLHAPGASDLLDRFESYRAPDVEKWIKSSKDL